MLVRCPKCGFEQPKDRFCANCGIDIDNFRPERRGRAKDSNSAFYIFLGIVVFLATTWFLYQRYQNPQEMRQASNPAKSERLEAPTSAPTPESKSEPTATAIQALVPPTPRPTEVPTAPTAAPARFIVYLAEVPTEFLRDLSEDRNNRTESDVLIVSNYRGQVLNNPGLKLLDTPTTKTISNFEETLQFYSGSRDPRLKEALGLFINVLPLSIENKILHAKIEIRRALRAAQGDTIENQNVSKEVLIPEGSAAMIAGLLTRGRRPSEGDENAYQSSFLKILASDKFQSGGSDFVVFVEAASTGNP